MPDPLTEAVELHEAKQERKAVREAQEEARYNPHRNTPHTPVVGDANYQRLLLAKKKKLEALKFLQEYQAKNKLEYFNSGRALVDGTILRANPKQQLILDAWNNTNLKTFLYVGGNRSGKQQPCQSIVYAPDGEKILGDLVVGDIIFDGNGDPCFVSGVFDQGVKPVYRMVFDDGSSALCGPEHLWKAQSSEDRKRDRWNVYSTEEILAAYPGGEFAKGKSRWVIPVCGDFDFDEIAPKKFIHPYNLGVFIGDGSLSGNFGISFGDDEVRTNFISHLPEGYAVRFKCNWDWVVKTEPQQYKRIIDKRGIEITVLSNPMKDEIRRLGLNKLSIQKFIPEEYKYTSYENRLQLLRGLMDTDGYASKVQPDFLYYTSSKQLAKDVQWLVRSLGAKASIRTKKTKCHDSYQVRIRSRFCPFSIAKKADRWWSFHDGNGESHRTKDRMIYKIEYVGKMPCRCISVSSYDGTYLTNDFTVTHNTTLGVIITLSVMFGEWLWNRQPIHFPHSEPRICRLVAQDWEGVQQVIVPEIKKWWPDIRPYSTKKNSVGTESHWTDKKSGSFLTVFTGNQDVMLHESAKNDLVWFDEPISRAHYIANARGLVDRQGRELFTMTLLEEPWIDREIAKKTLKDKNGNDTGRRDPSVFVVETETTDNIGYGLTEEGVRDFAAKLTKEEYEVRIKGVPRYRKGLVYQMFKQEIHCKPRFRVPLDWPVDIAIDTHPRKPHSVLMMATSPRGFKYAIAEIRMHGDGKTLAEEIIRIIKWGTFRVNRIIIDPLSKGDSNSDMEGTTYQKIFDVVARFGYNLEVASKNKDAGILMTKEYLMSENGEASLFFFDDLIYTIREVEGLMWERPADEDKEKIQKVEDDMAENLYRLILLETVYVPPDDEDQEDEYGRDTVNTTTGY